MTSPAIEQLHSPRPRPSWRQRQDERFRRNARVRARQERSAKHGGRVGDRQHTVRPAQPAIRKVCNSVVTIDISRKLTRREHTALSLMLKNIKGITAINFQGGSILCAVDLNIMGASLNSCENMIQERVDRALE